MALDLRGLRRTLVHEVFRRRQWGMRLQDPVQNRDLLPLQLLVRTKALLHPRLLVNSRQFLLSRKGSLRPPGDSLALRLELVGHQHTASHRHHLTHRVRLNIRKGEFCVVKILRLSISYCLF